jgi:hypothetical protein
MLRRNVAHQSISFNLVSATDGSPVTGGAEVRVARDAGPPANHGGTLSHIESGAWRYTLSQSETDAESIHVIATATGAVPVSLCLLTADAALGPIAREATVTSVLNRLGSFAGSGMNTVLGFLRAMLRRDVGPAPSDVGGAFDPATDSLEAIRDRGDAAWTTGTGGGGTVNANVIQVNGQPVTTGSVSVTVLAPKTDSGIVLLIRGDDYAAADNRAIVWSGSEWPNLTGATVMFSIWRGNQRLDIPAVVTAAGTGTQSVRGELTSAQTAQLEATPRVAEYRYEVVATLSSLRRVTLVRGQVVVEGPGV